MKIVPTWKWNLHLIPQIIAFTQFALRTMMFVELGLILIVSSLTVQLPHQLLQEQHQLRMLNQTKVFVICIDGSGLSNNKQIKNPIARLMLMNLINRLCPYEVEVR